MLSSLIRLSLRHRAVVIALAAVLLGYGLYVTTRARLDVFPEFAPPQVVIQTEAPGLSAEEVEQLVTRPIETALAGTRGLHALRSQSIQGLSIVTLVFKEDTDIYRARQLVSERFTEIAEQLPQGVEAPKMGPLIGSTSVILSIGLTSSNRSPMELRTFADWVLGPRLLSVPGVAKLDVFGGEVRQLQVQVDPDRLVALDLALDDVVKAAREATGVRGGGFVDTPNQRITLRTYGQNPTPAQLSAAVLAHRAGRTIRLRDVARVVEGAEPKLGDALIMGRPGVIIVVTGQLGANTLEVTTAVERALEDMQPMFAREQITLHPRLFRPANFIERALRNINHSLWLGGLLVLVVLFFFLLDWRTALISFLAIPLSLLAAVVILDAFGVTLNTITLGGFAIAIGVVVDDAIIDVENILRRVRAWRASAMTSEAGAAPTSAPASERRLGLLDVILHASIEVRHAIVYATFIVALVFLPVLTMSGVQGRLFAPLGIAFILAILASLLVSLTVTPALCMVLLSWVQARAEPGHVRWLKAWHRRGLEVFCRHPGAVVCLAALLCAGAAATLPFFGGEFLPEFREGHYYVHMAAVPGTSLAESLRLGRQVTQALLEFPEVRAVSQQAGRAELGEDPFGTHYSEIHVDLHPLPGEAEEQFLIKLRERLKQFAGVSFKVMPYLVERMEETISGTTAEFVVNIVGDDLDLLEQKAEEVRRVLEQIPGAVDVNLEVQPGLPELRIHLRRDRLQQYGFSPVPVLEAVQTAYQGLKVAEVYEGNRVFDVTVLLDAAQRRHPEGVGGLLLRNREGVRVPLRQLADIELTNGRYGIVHEAAQRRAQVSCNVQGRDVAGFTAEAKRRLQETVSLPKGAYFTFTGSAEAQQQARRQIIVHSLLAGAGILVLLALVFGNGRNLLLVLTNLPFALVGGVLAVFACGGALSVGSLVGFVTLFGLTMRNSIMMISHFEHLVRVEGISWGWEAALRGASERLLPILMTALVTALGLLPLAIGTGEAGREIEGPMAIVILGGLFTSTALNLLVLPSLALRWGRFDRRSSSAD